MPGVWLLVVQRTESSRYVHVENFIEILNEDSERKPDGNE